MVKKTILYIIICLLAIPTVSMAVPQPIWLEPGIYEILEDLPSGQYDVRFKQLDNLIRISYSTHLNEDGSLDMTRRFSYSISYTAKDWWQAVYPIITVLSAGYLQIEHSPCELWPVDL